MPRYPSPVLDRLAGRLDRPESEAFLTHAALRPFTQSCTQIGQNGPLLRNYNLPPDECEGTIVSPLLPACDTVDQAVARLQSSPIAVPQNLTLVDPVQARRSSWGRIRRRRWRRTPAPPITSTCR